jgi:hypothetical protein
LSSLFLLNVSPAHADLTTGLVAQYSFDDCTATDNSGNGHDGTINGNPQCVDGVKGKAFSFSGISTDYIRVNVKTADLFSNDFSIGVWVKFNNFTNDYPRIIEAENDNIVLHGLGTAYGNLQNHIGFYQQNQNGYPSSRIGGMASSSKLDNQWHFLTVVKTGLQFKMYVDSALSTSTSAVQNISMDGNFITIGSSIISHTKDGIDGQIDDTRIYNRAL